ncbi:MAG: hypothetical protein K2X27_26120 [Candidatus Obscuribacterales bacterium]|nr:hypothetical protein [Candidatus Obscuribacterales bacterium]
METLKLVTHILVLAAIPVLAVLLFWEYRTRELAVTGARLDMIELQLRQVETLANLSKNADVLKEINGDEKHQFPSARDQMNWAIKAYSERDFNRARIHIHNLMFKLDYATALLLNESRPKVEAEANPDTVPAPTP